jgi:hypothetical protein
MADRSLLHRNIRGAGHGAEQDAGRAARQRVPRVLPGQRRRVLRQLLRLLPARGLHPLERHLHREGLVDQRRDRPAAPPRHDGAALPARRGGRRLGVVHLRPRLARRVRGPRAALRSGEELGRDAACASWSTCSTSATTSTSSAGPSGCGATRSRCSRPTTSGRPGRVLRRRGRPHRPGRPAHRRGQLADRASSRLPGLALRRPARRIERRSARSRPSCEERLAEFEREGKLLEAQRLRMRTTTTSR